MTATPLVQPPTPPRPPLLLERELELAAAARAVDTLLCPARPEGGVLVYTGEAGVGKTALLGAVRTTAENRCTVWSARGSQATTSLPFHLVRQLLHPVLDGLSAKEARELLAEDYEIAGPAVGLAPASGPPTCPQGVCEGLGRLVGRLACSHGPLVLIVDDAHWADTESLCWLSSFSAGVSGLPLLIVVAHRPPELYGSELGHLTAVGEAARMRVTLQAFTPEATAELVRDALGTGADASFCREVWAVTGGNPYETVELLEKVRSRDIKPVAESADLLRGIGATARGRGLIDRLEQLGADATRFAWAAAVLGTDISLELVQSLAGLGAAQAADCLARLRDARILTASDPLEFVHSQIATAVYRAIPPATRTAMHGSAAWLTTQAGLGPAAASRHLLEVQPDDDPEVVQQLRAAAAEHLAVGAPDAARRCLERALREPPHGRLRAQVHYELGCATLHTSLPTTVRHLRAALDLPGLDDDLRVDATCRLAQTLAHNNEMREAAASVKAALAHTPPGLGRLRLQAAHFMYEACRGEEDDGQGRARRLAALADHLPGSTNAERALLTVRAFDAMLRGEDAGHVASLCDRALDGGRPPRGLGWTDTEWGCEYPVLIGINCTYTDQLDRAEDLFTEALLSYEISGWKGVHLALVYTLMGGVHRRRGRLAEAETFLREGLRHADRVGAGLPVHWDAACRLIDTLLARGRTEEAQRIADEYDFAPPYPDLVVCPDVRTVRARLLLAQGRPKDAVVELEAAGAALEARGRHNTVCAPWALELARALARDDPGRAASLAARARQHAERFGTDTAVGESLRCAAAVADPDAAAPLLAQAVARLAASPSTYEHALARVEYGLLTGNPAELRRGFELAERCGADTLAARAWQALASGQPRT
ncbi:ATP-binding protein [Streptomyces jeddahensis]|uniref:Tetratricopeptide repeat protein n=1 Tax=Streptomyces jeddahensis TaxID=1716141 RepID=A0A177HSQ8_9ACTN|nr:ATP-binding protein [Streptomyces jeddahensis]OAH13639.1 tetratricopeptide repeat protein [Streptomyces jeddahensis]